MQYFGGKAKIAKEIAFESVRDRVFYSVGAAFGSVAGLYVSSKILNFLTL